LLSRTPGTDLDAKPGLAHAAAPHLDAYPLVSLDHDAPRRTAHTPLTALVIEGSSGVPAARPPLEVTDLAVPIMLIAQLTSLLSLDAQVKRFVP
jgi:hypothetical protein